MDGTLAEEAQAPLDHRVGRLSPDQPRHRRQGINQLVADGVLYKRRGVGMFVATGAMSCLRGPALCPDARRTGHRRLGCRPALRSGFLDRGQSSSASLDLRGADACPAPIWKANRRGLQALRVGGALRPDDRGDPRLRRVGRADHVAGQLGRRLARGSPTSPRLGSSPDCRCCSECSSPEPATSEFAESSREPLIGGSL